MFLDPNPSKTRLHHLTRDHTIFSSFDLLINAEGFRPTIRPVDNTPEAEWKADQLADAYDREMKKRGDSRRAYRPYYWGV